AAVPVEQLGMTTQSVSIGIHQRPGGCCIVELEKLPRNAKSLKLKEDRQLLATPNRWKRFIFKFVRQRYSMHWSEKAKLTFCRPARICSGTG
ncbi:hypothetical protein L6R21_28295, partial [bacterium]|nr:hypothetical protein [bacterium]